MAAENWHTDFSPKKFLGRVDLAALIERNTTYNKNLATNSKSPCMFCGRVLLGGIYLNDKSFLCESCYSEVELISYPEKYENLRRQFLISREARRLAWDSFRKNFEYQSHMATLVLMGIALIILAYKNTTFITLTPILIILVYIDNRKTRAWFNRKDIWEKDNPDPNEPELKHFHDPDVVLTERDQLVLKVFNHWPGYPPFWKYLRSIVLDRDANRCQVTGCPSRLDLHIHHMIPVSEGGAHTPSNLVTLCDFHHALEPEKGHERIWGDIKTRHFTLVAGHTRNNRASHGTHTVRPHLRRLQLITLNELEELMGIYGFCCPICGEPQIVFTILHDRNVICVECVLCDKSIYGAQQLAEETGPMLAEILIVSKNNGRWKARWDMLAERTDAKWGVWTKQTAAAKRKTYNKMSSPKNSAPLCPKCGSPMKLVRPKPTDRWKAFWGCSLYRVTGCKGSAKYDE